MSKDLLSVRNLSVGFDTADGFLSAADNVSFDINEGEVLGLVGESGSGKTVTALSLMRLVPSPPGRITSGSVLFEGQDLLQVPAQTMQSLRGRKIGMIFQEPMSALSPLVPIGKQLAETLHFHQDISASAARQTGEDWLARVGLPDPRESMSRLPHQLSGGMRQRVMIAMALMLNPDVVIADEPTTALDVTVQAQIFDLLLKVKSEKSAVLYITHDMGAVWEICDRMLVMHGGQIVEEGAVRHVFDQPRHAYTRQLLQAAKGADAL